MVAMQHTSKRMSDGLSLCISTVTILEIQMEQQVIVLQIFSPKNEKHHE